MLLSALLAVAFDLNGTVVFQDGLSGVANYRIPVVVQTPTALVAFAEARQGGDDSASRIAVRTSADDGVTWSDVVFAAGDTYSIGSRIACNRDISRCRAGNPVAVWNAEAGEVALMYAIRGFGLGEDSLGNAMVTSRDGLHWSSPHDISKGFGAASGSLPGPGTALQLRNGSRAAGRLLVVSHHGAYERDYVSFSDDGGNAWQTINQSFDAMDEAALTQLPNGSVLLNMRHKQSPTEGRAIAVSLDGGETFGPVSFDPTLVSPVCQASIVSFGNATYFSNPASNSSRSHITIRRSTDDAVSWGASLLVQESESDGYSCLVKGALRGQPENGGILYEAAGGTINFARFPLSLVA